jgi:hypothetical protein
MTCRIAERKDGVSSCIPMGNQLCLIAVATSCSDAGPSDNFALIQ